MPSFFIPTVPLDELENALADYAQRVGRAAPAPEARVESFTFLHDGEEWNIEVGKPLTGVRKVTTGRGSKARTREVRLSDPATVLAIIPGDRFAYVFTDKGRVRSAWENPFMAGNADIRNLKRFDEN